MEKICRYKDNFAKIFRNFGLISNNIYRNFV